jgi:hypothetical protein
MELSNNPFLLAELTEEEDKNHEIYENEEGGSQYNSYYNSYHTEDNHPNSPKLININKSILNEMTSFFKLDNLFSCIRNDEKKEPKQNISISKIIMDNIIDKKLGYTTYHYEYGKSAKAYYTYDYPEIYYNKKLYTNISHWLKEEFSKKI